MLTTRTVGALTLRAARVATVGATVFLSAAVALASPAAAATAATSGSTVALAAVATVVAAPDATAVAEERQFVALINASRVAAGRSAYVTRGDLVSVARSQATRMASSQRLAHNPGLTTAVRSYRWVGENVGLGDDVAGLHRAFLASPAHRANIVDAQFTEVGIGIAIRGGRIWVCEVFRQPVRPVRLARTPSATPLLGVGGSGPAVTRLQALLGVHPDARFGATTRSALVRFQRAHGLPATGRADARTWRALSRQR